MDAAVVPHITKIELRFVAVQGDAHILLFFFIAAENTNLCEVRMQETPKNRVTEGPCTPGNKKNFIFEHVKTC